MNPTPARRCIVLTFLLAAAGCSQHLDATAAPQDAPAVVLIREDFTSDESLDRWTFRTPELWRIAVEGHRRMLQMAIPPQRPALPGVRRPQEYAVYNRYDFRSFSLSCRVRVDRDVSVAARDACIIFGRQDDTHFYYAHLSGLSNDVHNTLMRVDGQTRVSLVPRERQPAPTFTDREWHRVDILRDVDTGRIQVFFDVERNPEPVFDVIDHTYEWGQIGLGSFDDHASFAQLVIDGQARPRATHTPADQAAPATTP